MTGTLLNAVAIIAGSILGILIKSRLSDKLVKTIFQAIGLFTMVIGVTMSLDAKNLVIILIGLVAGVVIGEFFDFEKLLTRFTDLLRLPFKKKGGLDTSDFSNGFITATVLFCVGSMSILGPIEDGLGKTPSILYTKSVMDGISSVALASTFGLSIAVSSIPLLIYQGGISLLAEFMSGFMTESMIGDLTATGGILLIGLAVNILEIKKIKVVNMLPALIFVPVLSYFFA